MGSGTFGGIGSGNGVTPPAMPRTTLCVPDGPAACTVYELALDGSGNTTGAPAMDEQGDSTRQTTWRPFLSEPATLLHVVNGSRDPAVTFAPGYGAEGGSVGPLAINVPDAVDEAHWYVKPVASLPGHTPATSGGAGLPHAPLYVCSGFNRKHGTGEDRTTAPPDAYPLPVASVPGGGDPGSTDGESKASTGPCACSLGNPSVANVASTTDPGLGATKSPAGHWTDPVPAVIYSGFLDISKLVHGADDEEYDFDFPWLPGGILENVIRKLGWKAARACDDVVQDARDAWEESKEKWSGIIERIGNGTASDADWADLGELGSDVGHFLLELVGAMPLPVVSSLADGLNALWYAAEGKYIDAAMSALGAIPVIGDALSGMWVLTRQSIRAASTVADAGKILSSFHKFATTMAAKMLGGSPQIFGPYNTTLDAAFATAHGFLSRLMKSSKSVPNQNIVVIGENMDRVREAAKILGAEVYEPLTILPKKPTSAQVADSYVENGKWLMKKMREGCLIVDIGWDRGRITHSKYYELERHLIREYGPQVKWWWPDTLVGGGHASKAPAGAAAVGEGVPAGHDFVR